jgi:hypothetical protein
MKYFVTSLSLRTRSIRKQHKGNDTGAGLVRRLGLDATLHDLGLRLVEANSSSCSTVIDLYMLLDAPLSLFRLVLPRWAATAAPAAQTCRYRRACRAPHVRSY